MIIHYNDWTKRLSFSLQAVLPLDCNLMRVQRTHHIDWWTDMFPTSPIGECTGAFSLYTWTLMLRSLSVLVDGLIALLKDVSLARNTFYLTKLHVSSLFCQSMTWFFIFTPWNVLLILFKRTTSPRWQLSVGGEDEGFKPCQQLSRWTLLRSVLFFRLLWSCFCNTVN